MGDEEDVKKIMEVIQCCKTENVGDIQYDEFICYDSTVEEDEEPKIEDDIFLKEFSNTDISSLSIHNPRSTLKPEEMLVIDTCTDIELKELLLLNRKKNIKLVQLYKKMKDLLIECQSNISEKSEAIKTRNAKKWQLRSTGAWRLAAPYFKDKKLYSCPSNSDAIRKRKNKELTIYDLSCPSRWSNLQCKKLVRAVKLNFNINQQTAIVKEIQELKKSDDFSDRTLKLRELKTRLEELRDNDDSEIPPLNSDEYINWVRVADTFLQDQRSSFECRSIWHIYLHPFINKCAWTLEEDTKLKELANKYNFQNWEQIAKDLATNRTGFMACVNYYKNLQSRFKRGDFTHDEDAKLLELVHQYKMGDYIPWFKIVQHFKNRSRNQLHFRYRYYLCEHDRKKGKFTETEDIMLMIVVDKVGRNFKKCAEYLPNRSMIQCKARYNAYLQKFVKKGFYTVEEDKAILKYVEEHGAMSWTSISKLLNRTRGQVRQRYYTVKQFLGSNDGLEIDSVPRRKKNLNPDRDFEKLRIIADQYRDNPNIPSLREIEITLMARSNNRAELPDIDSSLQSVPETIVKTRERVPIDCLDIDTSLTNFFCNSFKINSVKDISSNNMRRAVQDVETILDFLKVDLDIPENFNHDKALDNIDVAILSCILEKKIIKVEPSISHINEDDISLLVSPNLNTLVGLRSLLIKFSNYKSEEETLQKFMNNTQRSYSISGARSNIINNIITLPPDIREQVEMDRNLFYHRFYALFKWPAVLTLEGPFTELESVTRVSKRPEVKRTYSKSSKCIEASQVKRDSSNIDSKNGSNTAVKRLKISDLPSSSCKAVPLTLTPVTNKSVIEGLLRDKTKKLFMFDQVKCDTKTETVIKEVNISHIRETFEPPNGTKVNSSGELRNHSKEISSEASSSSNGESFKFSSQQGECVIMDSDDSEDNSIGSENSCTVVDDMEDLEKLNMFLNQEHVQEQDIDGYDCQDLQKLDALLKTEENIHEQS